VVRGISSDNGILVVMVQDRFSGVEREIQAVAVVDAGFRLPNDEVPISSKNNQQVVISVGDCVAPRTILEAILEGRRAALHI
jgi:2,4-dienoyl-CoA reductase (NADPH2)